MLLLAISNALVPVAMPTVGICRLIALEMTCPPDEREFADARTQHDAYYRLFNAAFIISIYLRDSLCHWPTCCIARIYLEASAQYNDTPRINASLISTLID